jgi:transposase
MTICGVDLSSEVLDVRIGRDGRPERFDRTPLGIEAFGQFCKTNGVTLVVMEATGGYEKLPFILLWQLGIPGAIVNPRAVRQFAEAMGFLEKTDVIDAGIIAWFAEVKRIVAQEPLGEAHARLEALVTRLRQVTDLKTAQSNQRRLVTEPSVLTVIDELTALLRRQTRSLERQIAELIDNDPLWAKLDEVFRSIKGVADRTVARIMADLPEIGTLSNKAIAKLAGAAPLARDSGKTKGKRPIRGGRASVRSILFVVADVVRRYDPDFAAFHERLSLAGKPKKVIRIALARKLLVRLNAKAREVRREHLIAA